MKRIVIGTAGHIDHGKTALVRALTGVETDRLAQEKERGITIELGFTHVDLPSGLQAGFVDVPGHEKFVRTMIAGAWGLDLVVLVVAADEGVMPQTREHLDICELLGVQSGLIALNKSDLVDEEMLELATEDIRDAVAGTFLDNRPIVPVSATTGAGMDDLLAALDRLARVSERTSGDAARLPIDRVFTLKGFGTVVTGTAADGEISIGDALEIQPSGRTVKVRGVQVHGHDVEAAQAGQRTAINLQGVDKEDVRRGDVLVAPGTLGASYMLNVEYSHLSTAPKAFAPRQIRFLSGTCEALGALKLLEAEHVQPGETVLAQVRLEQPVAVRADDRFVIRTYSPMVTVGGGRILDPIARKYRRKDDTKLIAALATAVGTERVKALVDLEGFRGLGGADARLRLPASIAVDEALRALTTSRRVAALPGNHYIARSAFDRLAENVRKTLKHFHREQPAEPGMRRGALVSTAATAAGLGGTDARTIIGLITRALVESGDLASDSDLVRLGSHTAQVEGELATWRDAVGAHFKDAGLTPPTVEAAAVSLDVPASRMRQVVELLARSGDLLRAKEGLYFHREPVESVQKELVAWIEEHGQITTLEFKTISGISRKYMIPLLEHFDAVKLTIRVGDARVLRGKGGG